MREQPKPVLQPDDPSSAISKDDRLPVTVSAYLDGELLGDELASFEALLKANPALASEVAEMRQIEKQLAQIGSDILAEPVPEALTRAIAEFQKS
ncbi:hypothetical protein KKP04_00365 [Rhodomicrobium sp. Az07]|uniref:anti-sigma factor family protein n=1 Tax=Rhodomicrobium sp. Az07 TaxID=2839034 RepID=UPI001BE72D57|nr:hypothetical protein [Rhodomicrobium sp. Az07]MBT3069324.1 hypothetical protein [Rhodomicrobium sp. Az07]